MKFVPGILLFVLAVGFVRTSLPAVAQVVVATVPVGSDPAGVATNSITNKTYVANVSCISLQCPNPGTVTVIDGATNNTMTVNVGFAPVFAAVNTVTNKIYVANECGNDDCQSYWDGHRYRRGQQ